MTSSGQSGAFSVGLTSPAEQRAQGRLADEVLRSLGASPDSPTLLLNCLPMGIGAPPATFAFVGGEWVAESLRGYVSGVVGLPDPAAPGPGVLVSMGAAEIGL